jgi:hypothetical protein
VTLSLSAQTALLVVHSTVPSLIRNHTITHTLHIQSLPSPQLFRVTANSHRTQLPSSRALFTHRRSQPHLLGIHPIFMQESMTFKSTSTSGTTSSKASSLFDLDENSNKGILVYRFRSGAAGLDTTTEAALCAELDQRKGLLHRTRR